jgi:phosphate acyltransferase
MPTVIAVDAMGSDRAPKPEVEGAILALREHADVRVLLVGQQERLHAELTLHPHAARLPR